MSYIEIYTYLAEKSEEASFETVLRQPITIGGETMATTTGQLISLYRGETLKISVKVKNRNGTPADLTGAIGKFAIKNNYKTYTEDCTILGDTVSVVVASSQTEKFRGTYTYEIRARYENGDVDSLVIGTIVFEDAIILTIPDPVQ